MSPLLTMMKQRILPVSTAAVRQLEHGKLWLMPRGQQAAFISAGVVLVLLLLIFSGVTAAVAAVAAWIALMRHFAQTDADRQRRITESYSKAVEQLAHDKIEVRLGGIYTLERISRESQGEYRTIMETLTAFVRERTRRGGIETSDIESHGERVIEVTATNEPPTDIAAVLAVIVRRPETERNREKNGRWRIDLRGADLRGACLSGAHLEGAILRGAHLARADLSDAHLDGADLQGVNLEEANLTEAHLEGARLPGARLKGAKAGGAHLERSNLWGAHFEGANLVEAHLESANLLDAYFDERARLGQAHLEGANLVGATVSQKHIESAFGDAATGLPVGLSRPASWSPAKSLIAS